MKRLIIVFSIIIIFFSFINFKSNAITKQSNKVNAAVLFYSEDTDYIKNLKNDLESIASDNTNNINFTFFDGKNDESMQMKQMQEVINSNFDLIALSLVDLSKCYEFINLAKSKNVPIVFFNREPDLNCIKSYGKSLFIGTNACEAGRKQAEMIKKMKDDGKIKDINLNGKVDYILMRGSLDSIEADERTRCVKEYMKSFGIDSNLLREDVCDWTKECAKTLTESMLYRYANSVEFIISNNDDMAIGMIEALQSVGINTGDSKNYIPAIGVDGTNTALNMIKNGEMAGTVIQDHKSMADAIYKTGVNFVNKRPPLENTNYEFDSSGVAIRIPYGNYVIQ